MFAEGSVLKYLLMHSLSQVREEKDIILLATKATDMMDVALPVDSVLKKNGYLISMQNGICEDDLASVIGKNRIIGCVTGWGATMESKGKLKMTSTGDFIIGYPEGKAMIFFLILLKYFRLLCRSGHR